MHTLGETSILKALSNPACRLPASLRVVKRQASKDMPLDEIDPESYTAETLAKFRQVRRAAKLRGPPLLAPAP